MKSVRLHFSRNLLGFFLSVRNIDFSLYGGAETLYEGKQLLNSGLCKAEVQHNTDSRQESIARINGVDYKSPRRTVITNPHNPGDVYNVPPRDTSDFLWIMTEEPHRSRRMAIMKKHPEVSELFRCCGWSVLVMVVLAAWRIPCIRPNSGMTKVCRSEAQTHSARIL